MVVWPEDPHTELKTEPARSKEDKADKKYPATDPLCPCQAVSLMVVRILPIHRDKKLLRVHGPGFTSSEILCISCDDDIGTAVLRGVI